MEQRFNLQKLTLLDYPGLVACTVFSANCNFQCPFCHNAPLISKKNEMMDFSLQEVLGFLKTRRKILDGVCFTGGEPLFHPEIISAIAEVHNMGFSVKLDTNGSFPERLKEVVSSGIVDYVAMDIKNSPGKYEMTCGKKDILKDVDQSVQFLRLSGISYEFRTTAAGGFHTPLDFEEIGKWIGNVPRYFIQKFVMTQNVLAPDDKMNTLTMQDMQSFLSAVKPFIPSAKLRGC